MYSVMRAVIAAGLLSFGLVANADVDPAYKEAQEKADANYQAGEFKKAYKTYEDLAEVGDSFSQYRASTMSLYGQGVKQDPAEAYAWAVLAAQNKNEDLVTYRDLLWQGMSKEEQKDAKKLADKYMKKYSNLALAEKAARKTRRRLSSCTGSRLSTRCEDVYQGSAVTGAGVAAGGGPTTAAARATTTGGASEFGGTDRVNQSSETTASGAPSRDFEYYLGLRETLKQLDRYIEEHSGTVTLGDFEVIEEPVPSEGGS